MSAFFVLLWQLPGAHLRGTCSTHPYFLSYAQCTFKMLHILQRLITRYSSVSTPPIPPTEVTSMPLDLNQCRRNRDFCTTHDAISFRSRSIQKAEFDSLSVTHIQEGMLFSLPLDVCVRPSVRLPKFGDLLSFLSIQRQIDPTQPEADEELDSQQHEN